MFSLAIKQTVIRWIMISVIYLNISIKLNICGEGKHLKAQHYYHYAFIDSRLEHTIMPLYSPHDQLLNAVSKPRITRGRLIKTQFVIILLTHLKWLMPVETITKSTSTTTQLPNITHIIIHTHTRHTYLFASAI